MPHEVHQESGAGAKAGSPGSAGFVLAWILGRSGAGLWILLAGTALIAGVAFAWSVQQTWIPVVRAAVGNWPGLVRCREGRFEFPTDQPRLLAEGHDLALVLDPRQEGTVRAPAWVQVQWGSTTVRVLGPLGELEARYPRTWTFERDPASVRATWEAWEAVVRVGLGLAVTVSLLLVWPVMAAVYGLVLGIGARFLRRQAQGGWLWRMGLLVQLPGAWFMIASLVGFGAGWLSLLGLGVALGLHWVVTWCLLAGLIWCLPRRARVDAIEANPFAAALRAGIDSAADGRAAGEDSGEGARKPS